MFKIEPASREEYANELEILWKGSGYSCDSMREKLNRDFTCGKDVSYDGSLMVCHFKEFSVVFSVSGYYFVNVL